jgi:hypothetical protein
MLSQIVTATLRWLLEGECCQVFALARCILIQIFMTLWDTSDDLPPHRNIVIELHV